VIFSAFSSRPLHQTLLGESAQCFRIPLVNICDRIPEAADALNRCDSRAHAAAFGRFLETLPRDEVVLRADAFDTFFAGTAEEIESRFDMFGKPIVFSAEINYWPPECGVVYPPAPTRFAYVNGGGFAGRVDALLEMLCAPDFWPLQANVDQWAYADYYVRHTDAIALDCSCDLWVSLFWMREYNPPPNVEHSVQITDRRLRNDETNSWPLLCHGNGGYKGVARRLWDQLRQTR
jgi:hypothetical protein